MDILYHSKHAPHCTATGQADIAHSGFWTCRSRHRDCCTCIDEVHTAHYTLRRLSVDVLDEHFYTPWTWPRASNRGRAPDLPIWIERGMRMEMEMEMAIMLRQTARAVNVWKMKRNANITVNNTRPLTFVQPTP